MFVTAIAFVVSLALALVLTPPVRALARRMGAVDAPDQHRRVHTGAIPRLGGVAVFCGFYLTVFLVGRFGPAEYVMPGVLLAWRFLIPSLVILGLGIVDDLTPVKPVVKLAVQTCAALWLFYASGVRIETLSSLGGGVLLVGSLSLLATIFWVLLLTNAFNVVDGMDGLASGVALIAICTLFLASIERGNDFSIPLVTAALAGALVGFLRYNFNPASVFLGDSGSLWLGFMLAALSIVGFQKSSTAIAIAAPIATMGLPVVETAISMLRRFLRGQPVFQADGRHIHHQLLRKGLSPRRAALVLYAGSGACGIASLFLVSTNDTMVGLISIVLAFSVWLGIQHLGYSELSEFNNALRRGLWYQRRIIQNCVAVRTLSENLRRADRFEAGWAEVADAARQLQFARVELRVADDYRRGSVNTLASLSAPEYVWAGEDTVVLPEERWVVFSIHLRLNGAVIGTVDLWRRKGLDDLHSELALLISAISEGLPRLLEKSSLPESSPAAIGIAPSTAALHRVIAR